jgi:putative pyruvate formate lyase activating enzyme
MPPMITMENIADIIKTVRDLKCDRDTWQAVALQYKEAFEAQTKRLHELRDVCFATQAELENERAEQRRLCAISSQNEHGRRNTLDGTADSQTNLGFGTAAIFTPPKTKVNRQRHLHALSDQNEYARPVSFDGADDSQAGLSFGTATIFTTPKVKTDHQRQSSQDYTNPLFSRVQECTAQRNYGTAMIELECLLRGPLSLKARAEGLLLKSNILKTCPDDLLDALAACSEALQLCDRLSELQSFLPKIQYQRGLLFYDLRLLDQAREAFNAVGDDNILSAKAHEYRKSCDDELGFVSRSKRRSGFHEERNMEGLLAQLEEKGPEACWRWNYTVIRAC